MGRNIDKLISIAGDPLSEAPPEPGSDVLVLAGNLASHLSALLAEKNGFYVFESALHVFPRGGVESVMSLDRWNSASLWRGDYHELAEGCLFFAEDIFGGQFCIKDDRIFTFDPETGELEGIADAMEGWAQVILEDCEVLTGYPLAHAWQENLGPIAPGMRLVPKIPFVLGGEYEVENLHLLDAVKGMKLRASLAWQIRNLPDGAQVEYRITDE